MPALNFKKQFAPKVEAGIKRNTIRRRRKYGRDPKAGDTLYLYTGMRTKGCRRLGEAKCKSSMPILIDKSDIVVAGQLLYPDKEYELAIADGFECVSDFREFFLDDWNEQFEGFLISW